MEEASNNNTEVFVYTEGVAVPQDVVRVRVHPSVTVIPDEAFHEQKMLEEVELCEGLLEIGEQAFSKCKALKRISVPSTVTIIHPYAFSNCDNLEELELFDGLQEIEQYAFFECNSLKRLTIPNTVRSIGGLAFCHSYTLQHLQLPEGIESIGIYTFSHNRCPTIRIPPNFTTLTKSFIGTCRSMFSLELSEHATDIETDALYESRRCRVLRNMALPPNAKVKQDAILRCTDLQQLFVTEEQITNALKHRFNNRHLLGSEEQLINALKHRFDNLPIHKMIYYQSYNNVTADQLNNATDIRISQRRSKLNPTGRQQDNLGMTPLHILACSSVQNIELYKVLVNKYPETLITKDRWGALPLLYAVWGNAPDEIVKFLAESYKSLYPDYELDWTEMVVTFGKATAQEVIQKLLDIQKESFPDQRIDWDQVFDELTKPNLHYFTKGNLSRVLRYLVKYSMAERISALGPRKWRDDMACKLEEGFSFFGGDSTPKGWFDGVSLKLSDYEIEYINLKEATTLIELTLWKNKIAENFQEDGHINKRAKIDETDRRKECRINCGADIVIEHVLPYLL